ncbi:unnamed protein product [Rhizophagus irregularis]|nr:unnamed protein product [Rhizophagus irregularis]
MYYAYYGLSTFGRVENSRQPGLLTLWNSVVSVWFCASDQYVSASTLNFGSVNFDITTLNQSFSFFLDGWAFRHEKSGV